MPSQSMVFLPGFMCDQAIFRPQREALSQAGISCSVGDLTKGCSIERMAQLVLRNAPDRFALAGLSMGGIVAMEICKQAPERVTHLALLNTTARADASGATRKQQLGRVAAGHLDMVLRDELKPQYLAPENRTPKMLSLLETMGVQLGEHVFCRQTMALTIRRSYLDSLEQIQCPVLLVAGAQDNVCPVDRHEEIAARIPGATLKVLERCGHISTLEQPDAVSEALLALLDRPRAHLTRGENQHLTLVK